MKYDINERLPAKFPPYIPICHHTDSIAELSRNPHAGRRRRRRTEEDGGRWGWTRQREVYVTQASLAGASQGPKETECFPSQRAVLFTTVRTRAQTLNLFRTVSLLRIIRYRRTL